MHKHKLRCVNPLGTISWRTRNTNRTTPTYLLRGQLVTCLQYILLQIETWWSYMENRYRNGMQKAILHHSNERQRELNGALESLHFYLKILPKLDKTFVHQLSNPALIGLEAWSSYWQMQPLKLRKERVGSTEQYKAAGSALDSSPPSPQTSANTWWIRMAHNTGLIRIAHIQGRWVINVYETRDWYEMVARDG